MNRTERKEINVDAVDCILTLCTHLSISILVVSWSLRPKAWAASGIQQARKVTVDFTYWTPQPNNKYVGLDAVVVVVDTCGHLQTYFLSRVLSCLPTSPIHHVVRLNRQIQPWMTSWKIKSAGFKNFFLLGLLKVCRPSLANQVWPPTFSLLKDLHSVLVETNGDVELTVVRISEGK